MENSPKPKWFEQSYVFYILLIAPIFLGVMQIFAKETIYKIIFVVVIGAVTALMALRAFAISKAIEERNSAEEILSVSYCKKVTTLAKRAATEDESYFSQVAELGQNFFEVTVRICMYAVEKAEPTDAVAGNQESTYYLRKIGDNSPARPMTKKIMPDDPNESCAEMVNRALRGTPLFVKDVTKAQKDWVALEDTPEQRSKYMSFVSLAVPRWDEAAPIGLDQPAGGLLCVDAKEVESFSEREEERVQIIAEMMALGLNAIRPTIPSPPANLPHKS